MRRGSWLAFRSMARQGAANAAVSKAPTRMESDGTARLPDESGRARCCPLFRRLATLFAMTAGVVTSMPSPALANGIDLPTRQAMQGDEISVTGHAWLTCCPTNTPVEHVQLFLCEGPCWKSPQQVLLFDVPANEEGVISTVFTVPWVTPGRYRLEACGGDHSDGSICLPEGRFTVLLGPPSPTPTPNQHPIGDETDWWLPALVMLVIGVATAIAYLLNRRSRTST